jgi:hypothetical protein
LLLDSATSLTVIFSLVSDYLYILRHVSCTVILLQAWGDLFHY